MTISSPLPPEQINEIFLRAVDNHQRGNLKEAENLYLDLLENFDAPLLHYNLGLVFYDRQEYTLALERFQRAELLDPKDPDIVFNLALCHKQCGNLKEAVQVYERARLLDSGNEDILYNLAGCYRELHEYQTAVELYLEVIESCPTYQSAINNLAYVYHLQGHTEEAVSCYSSLLEINPHHEAARHMHAALVGDTPASSPLSYVREVFDNYSDRYEESLKYYLQYSVPEKLRELLNSIDGLPISYGYGIDLGCGTGLSGQPFAEITSTLDGVDLSEKMISVARDKKIYSTLTTGDLIRFLRECASLYDLAIAADVCIYLGDLREFFTILGQRMNDGGVFCFSSETTDCKEFILQPTGRFAYSRDYITSLALECGWTIINRQETRLRIEKEDWIAGDLWVFRRNA